jgi:hypothetical protein
MAASNHGSLYNFMHVLIVDIPISAARPVANIITEYMQSTVSNSIVAGNLKYEMMMFPIPEKIAKAEMCLNDDALMVQQM